MRRQGRIPVGCIYSLLALTSHQMSVPVWGSSSEQIETGLQSWPPDVTSKGWGGEGVGLGPCTERGLYSEVQCIMGNGHMEPPSLWMDRLTYTHD